jgi:hypothetical protein
MFSGQETFDLRVKIWRTLKTNACTAIRFKLDNVRIQTYMYTYMADAVYNDRVHVAEGRGNGYDDETNTLRFLDADPEPYVLVHETTHAIIDATHPGKSISKGAHEASAYLAETIWAIHVGEEVSLDVARLDRPVYQLAKKVIAFNQKNKSGLYDCHYNDTFEIKAILNGMYDVSTVRTMDGIGDDKPPKRKSA